MAEEEFDGPATGQAFLGRLRPNFVGLGVLGAVAGAGAWLSYISAMPYLLPASVAIGFILGLSPKVINQWERGIVLRLGKFNREVGSGLWWIVPLAEKIVAYVDMRIITTSFTAEKTLTKDTVPVNVDAVLFWHVRDARMAALDVENYRQAIYWAAQTALRDIIGKTELSDLLAGRDKIDASLQAIIDARTETWGVIVQSVEIRDVVIPDILQDAMSRQAQAERERQARVILSEAECEIAHKFAEASLAYADKPMAYQLRAMNLLYEGMKEKGALVIVPSTVVESLGLGTVAGLTALQGQMLKKPLGTDSEEGQ